MSSKKNCCHFREISIASTWHRNCRNHHPWIYMLFETIFQWNESFQMIHEDEILWSFYQMICVFIKFVFNWEWNSVHKKQILINEKNSTILYRNESLELKKHTKKKLLKKSDTSIMFSLIEAYWEVSMVRWKVKNSIKF